MTPIDLTDPATYALWLKYFDKALAGCAKAPEVGCDSTIWFADAVAQAAVALIQERERAVRKPQAKAETPQPEKATCKTCGGKAWVPFEAWSKGATVSCPTCSKQTEAPAPKPPQPEKVPCNRCGGTGKLHRLQGYWIHCRTCCSKPAEAPAWEHVAADDKRWRERENPEDMPAPAPDWTTGPDGKPDSSAEFERVVQVAINQWREGKTARAILSHLAHVEGLAPSGT
jgi:hypothetical protein